MPRVANPLAIGGGGLASGLSDAFGLLMRMPSPTERADADATRAYRQAMADKARADMAETQQKLGAGGRIADAFRKGYAELPDPAVAADPAFPAATAPRVPTRDEALRAQLPDLAGAGVDAGGLANLGAMFRAYMANAQGVSPEATSQSMLGAGDAYNSTPTGFREDAKNKTGIEEMKATRAREAALAVAGRQEEGIDQRAGLTPIEVYDPASPTGRKVVSRRQAIDMGMAAPAPAGAEPAYVEVYDETSPTKRKIVSRVEAIRLGLAAPAPAGAGNPTPRNYVGPNGERGYTLDGMVDAQTRQPVPAGAQIFTGQVQSGDVSGLTKPVVTDIQRSQIALGDFNATMDALESVAASDPSIFGTVGNLRRFGQDMAGQSDALSSLLGVERFENVAADLQKAGVAPQFFDPNLSNVEKLAVLAAYQAASVLGQQDGKGLSNQDFVYFYRMIGDPTSWTSTQEKFIAGVKTIRTLANNMATNRANALRGQMPQAQPAAPAAAARPRATNPQTGEAVEFDGQQWVPVHAQ